MDDLKVVSKLSSVDLVSDLAIGKVARQEQNADCNSKYQFIGDSNDTKITWCDCNRKKMRTGVKMMRARTN